MLGGMQTVGVDLYFRWVSGQGFLGLPQIGISAHFVFRSPVPFIVPRSLHYQSRGKLTCLHSAHLNINALESLPSHGARFLVSI